MLKKLIFIALLTTFAIVSAPAQTKVDNYLGTWKLTSQKKNSDLKMITLNISVADEILKIEKITDDVRDGKDRSWTLIFSYKLNGKTLTSLQPLGDPASTYLQYPSDGKLRLFVDWGSNSTREDWRLSDDGKTLTIDTRKYGNTVRSVYAKQ